DAPRLIAGDLGKPYAQYPPAVQGYQNPNMIQNPGPAYQNPFNKPMTKQITCYFCGSTGHMASWKRVTTLGEKREQTKGNNEQYGQKQGGGWENPRTRGCELLDKGDKPTTRRPETLQINFGTKAVVKGG
ncbi:27530_t:CDS:2, partial [Racocetra persica]